MHSSTCCPLGYVIQVTRCDKTNAFRVSGHGYNHQLDLFDWDDGATEILCTSTNQIGTAVRAVQAQLARRVNPQFHSLGRVLGRSSGDGTSPSSSSSGAEEDA